MQKILLLLLFVTASGNNVIKEYLEAVAKFGVDKMILQPSSAELGGFGGGEFSGGMNSGDNYGSGIDSGDISDHYSSGIVTSSLVDKKHLLAFLEFKKEVDFINSHDSIPFAAEVNKFSILTDDEREKYGGVNISRTNEDNRDLPRSYAQHGPVWGAGIPLENPSSDHNPLPDSLDWEKLGAQNEIRSQGKCLSSWAHAGISALETAYYLATGDLEAFSEQEVLDCAFEHRRGRNSCFSGGYNAAVNYVEKTSRIAYLKDTGFHDADRVCNSDEFTNALKKAKVVGSQRIREDDELKKGVARGAVVAGINIPRSFCMYKSGIYEDQLNCGTVINHLITVVGYGNIDGKNFWKIRNSWGPNWGENGYARFSRDVPNNCQISSHAFLPLMECRLPGTCNPPYNIEPLDGLSSVCQNAAEDAFCNRNVRYCLDFPSWHKKKRKGDAMKERCKKACKICE